MRTTKVANIKIIVIYLIGFSPDLHVGGGVGFKVGEVLITWYL